MLSNSSLNTTIKFAASFSPETDMDDIVRTLQRHGVDYYELNGEGEVLTLEIRTSQLRLISTMLSDYFS